MLEVRDVVELDAGCPSPRDYHLRKIIRNSPSELGLSRNLLTSSTKLIVLYFVFVTPVPRFLQLYWRATWKILDLLTETLLI